MDNEVSAKTTVLGYEFYYKQPYFEQKNKEKLVFYSKFSYLAEKSIYPKQELLERKTRESCVFFSE